jgi:hypothetical protein
MSTSHRPCAANDEPVKPVFGVSHFFGSRSGEGETPFERSYFIEHVF